MRILIIGAGGVGIAAGGDRAPAPRTSSTSSCSPTWTTLAQASRQPLGDKRYVATAIDATNISAIVNLARIEEADVILNACNRD